MTRVIHQCRPSREFGLPVSYDLRLGGMLSADLALKAPCKRLLLAFFWVIIPKLSVFDSKPIEAVVIVAYVNVICD